MSQMVWSLPLGMLGGLLLVAAFLVSGRRWLHGLAALAFACLATAGWALDAEAVVAGSAVLLLVNLVQFFRISRRARSGALSGEDRVLIAEVLAIEEPAKQRRLRDVITWRDADTGEVLMRQGQIAPPLVYVATGQMAIEHEGLPVGTCGPDDFLGEMSLVTGEGASATVKVSMPARIAVFDRDGLLRLMQVMPELARAMDRRLNKGLADKIQRMNKASSGASAER